MLGVSSARFKMQFRSCKVGTLMSHVNTEVGLHGCARAKRPNYKSQVNVPDLQFQD